METRAARSTSAKEKKLTSLPSRRLFAKLSPSTVLASRNLRRKQSPKIVDGDRVDHSAKPAISRGHRDRMNPRRKLLLVLAAGVLLPRWAAAQRSTIFRVGWISLDRPGDSSFLDHFRTGLRDLGYVEGRNLMIDARWG